VLNIDQKKAVEIADEERVIALAAKRSERIDADRQVKQAEIIARKEVETSDVSREQALEAARLARRRAIEQLEVGRVQALQEAESVRAAVEAEAQRLLNEAENVLTDQARYSLFRRKLLDRIEGIVRESVKPMEKIEGIRILQVDGLNGGGGGGNGGRSATDEVIDSALRYRVQAPLIDSILADIGVEGGSLARMPGLIREARDMQGIKESASKGGQGKPEG